MDGLKLDAVAPSADGTYTAYDYFQEALLLLLDTFSAIQTLIWGDTYGGVREFAHEAFMPKISQSKKITRT